MTPEQIEKYRKAADDGSIADNKNPLFLLNDVHTDLLVKIINLDLNIPELAKHELKERGLNEQGKWVGFKQKAKVQTPLKSTRRKGRGI